MKATLCPPSPRKPTKESRSRDNSCSGKSTAPPPIPSKASRKPFSSSNKKHPNERGDIVKELLQNEEKFNKDMNLITKVLSAGLVSTRISPEDFLSIWLNLPDYISVSSEIIVAYKLAIEESPGKDPAKACIGKHFLPLIPKLRKEAIEFVKGFNPQLTVIRPYLKPYFDEVTEKLQPIDASTAVLSDRLLQGFQKSFHISNLFDRLKKSTPESHPDYKATCECYAQIQNLIEAAERAKNSEYEYSKNLDEAALVNIVPENVNSDSFFTMDERLTHYSKKMKNIKCFSEFLINWIGKKSLFIVEYVQKRRKLIACERTLVIDFKRVIKHDLKSRCLDFSEFNNSSQISTDKLKSHCDDITSNLSTIIKQMQKITVVIKDLKEDFKDVQKSLKKGDSSKQNAKVLLSSYRKQESNFIADVGNFTHWSEQIIECSLIYFYNLMVQSLFHASSLHNGELSHGSKILSDHILANLG